MAGLPFSNTPPSSAPYLHPLSDIFPDSPPSTPRLTSSEPSEIPSLRATHNTAGYRSGISSSKSASLQPGFDEGYSLGAVFGLRVGYLLGVLEGLCAASGGEATVGSNGDESEQEATQKRSDETNLRKLLGKAKQELSIESIFAKEFWGEDGIWKFEVEGNREGAQAIGENVTFEQVAEKHPLLQKWVTKVMEEMKRLGVVEGRFVGKEWENGRMKESDVR